MIGGPRAKRPKRIDLAGKCLLPGLIDAHYHATLTDTNPANLRDVPTTLMTARAANLLRGTLERGFTTVRDMGGAELGAYAGAGRGKVHSRSARLHCRPSTLHRPAVTVICGAVPSPKDVCNCAAALSFMSVVADGKGGACRSRPREQLRQGRGSHQSIFCRVELYHRLIR